ncbi:OmpA family protein [Celerinatantimonas yamalensis]|uniref:OmpA family protein n=1 Tax=Celerinatantimonas yamalensis TaxID=559956 RepID=A0ABW9G626_9GAMM
MRRRRRIRVENHNDTHRWLVSYADYMTLMFAFFVLLYAMAVANKSHYPIFIDRLNQAVEHLTQKSQHIKDDALLQYPRSSLISSGLGPNAIGKLPHADGAIVAPMLQSPPERDASELSDVAKRTSGQSLVQIKTQLDEALQSLEHHNMVEIDLNDQWLTITLNNQMLFASGSATLLDPAKQVLTRLSRILDKFNNYIRVRGYTDDEMVRSELFRSNWELSAIRATNVLHQLVALGVAPQRLAVEGFGQYSPKVANNNSANRRENRRVVIALSRFAWQPPAAVGSTDKESQPIKNTQENHPKGDSKNILTVPLPGGGVRFTTRQDNQ